MTVDAAISARVRLALKERGLSQRQAAALAHMSDVTLGARLRGETRWTAADLVTIARVLGVRPGDLLG